MGFHRLSFSFSSVSSTVGIVTSVDCHVRTRFKVRSNELLILCSQSSLHERVCSSSVDRMKTIDSTVDLPTTVDQGVLMQIKRNRCHTSQCKPIQGFQGQKASRRREAGCFTPSLSRLCMLVSEQDQIFCSQCCTCVSGLKNQTWRT